MSLSVTPPTGPVTLSQNARTVLEKRYLIKEKSGKHKPTSALDWVVKRYKLLGAAVAVGLLLAVAILWWLRPVPNRAAIEGEVKLDGVLIETGSILFESTDNATKGLKSLGPML